MAAKAVLLHRCGQLLVQQPVPAGRVSNGGLENTDSWYIRVALLATAQVEPMRRLRRGSLDGGLGSLRTASALVALAMFAAVAVPLGFAQSALAGEPDTIEGTVTSAATKAPVKGVEVCAGRFVYEQKCVSTGVEGTYVVPASPVPVHVEFNAPSGSGLVSHTFYNDAYIPSQAAELTVPVGEVFTAIDEELLPEGRVEGVVANASTKAPIEGVEVCASPLGAWPEEPTTCVSTDALGVYEILGLAPVQYRVKFNPKALNYLPESPQREYKLYPTVEAGSTTANVDETLPEGGQIEGQVKSAATGLPVTGVQACATGFGPALETKCARTDVEGRYLIDGLERSSYYVSFWPERPYAPQHYEAGKLMLVNQGETLSGVDGSLLAGATISGHVTSASSGEPVQAVEVCLTEYIKEEFDGRADEYNSGYCIEPNAAGEYQFTGIAASTNRVTFHPKPSGYEYEATESGSIHATVGESITGIDAPLRPWHGVIAGRVTNYIGGQGVSGAEVCARTATGESWPSPVCVHANAQGEYGISVLGGRYNVEFSSPSRSQAYVTELYDGKLSTAQAEPVTATTGSTTSGIDAELVERVSPGGIIAGVVTSAANRQPIAGVEVCAYEIWEEEHLFGRCATTESAGKYAITGLISGKYTVEFSSPSNNGLNYITQYYDEASSSSKSKAIAATLDYESVALGVNAQMHEGGRIAGDVDDATSGAPIPGISVCAYAEQEETLVGSCASTGQTGEYTIAGLPQGEYKVEFVVAPESALDYVGQLFDGQSSAKTATLVPVTVGVTTMGINAKLQIGGRISGRVAANSSGPLTNVLVCALATSSEAVACALTGRNGEYTIGGVPAGSYVIAFDDAKTHTVQYYDDQTVYADAQTVDVSVGASTTDIDATLGLAGGPVSSGPPPPITTSPPTPHGQALEEPLTPVSSTSQTPPTSASSQTSSSAASASTSTPTPAQATPVIVAPTPKVVISRSTAVLLLSCSDATCRGSIELTLQIMANRHEGGKAASHRETLVLARGYFSLAKGNSAAAVLHLTAAGRQRLAQVKRHPLAANLILSVQGGKTVIKSVMAY